MLTRASLPAALLGGVVVAPVRADVVPEVTYNCSPSEAAAAGWPSARREWCCSRWGLHCPGGALDVAAGQQMRSDGATVQPYECEVTAGWEERWTSAQLLWCCSHAQPTGCPNPNLMALPEAPRLEDPPQTQKLVSDGLQVIMNSASRRGAGDATTTAEEMRSGACGEGPAHVLEDAWSSWADEKRKFCCETWEVADTWSDDRGEQDARTAREYCCSHHGRGCPGPSLAELLAVPMFHVPRVGSAADDDSSGSPRGAPRRSTLQMKSAAQAVQISSPRGDPLSASARRGTLPAAASGLVALALVCVVVALRSMRCQGGAAPPSMLHQGLPWAAEATE